MRGQYFGEMIHKDGAGAGLFWLHVDPDRTSGYTVFKESGSPHVSKVAAISLSINSDGKTTLVARADVGLEKEFRIPDEHKLPVSFVATLTLDENPNGSACAGSWVSGDFSGHFKAEKSEGVASTAAQQTFSDWDAFKQWANKYTMSPGHAFRGQSAAHQLKTSFHRTGRVDLIRYIKNDLPVFVDYVETLTGFRYNLNDPNDFGSIVGFAQHHGFPTPLLDWTYSPYVAAYFAFLGVVSLPNPPGHVRIFRLDASFVGSGLAQPSINTIESSISVTSYKPSSRGNGRLLSQQGLFVFSNAVDIERQLRRTESEKQLNQGALLEVVDISCNQARRALADLRNMGTTAATLFPGLDGVAAHLKHSLFFAP